MTLLCALSNDLDNVNNSIQAVANDTGFIVLSGAEWNIGGINTTGNNANADNRLRIPNYKEDAFNLGDFSKFHVSVSAGYKYSIYFYNAQYVFDSAIKSLETDGDYTCPDNAYYVRFLLFKSDNANMLTDEGANLSVYGIYTVQERFEKIEASITNNEELMCDTITLNLSNKVINSATGGLNDSQYCLATNYKIPANRMTIDIPVEYKYYIMFYSNDTYLGFSGELIGKRILGIDVEIPEKCNLIRFSIRYNSSSITVPITPAEFSGYKIMVLTQNLQNEYSICPNAIFICRDSRVTPNVPPNSKIAIKMTAENQYDKVRFSVTKTTDGEYVAVHDVTINSLAVNMDGSTISEAVRTNECSLSQLNQYDWGLKYGQEYAGMTVPMLDDCLKYASMYNLTVALDFKWINTFTQDDTDNISSMLAKYGLVDTILFATNTNMKRMFMAKSKRFSYLFGGTMEELQNMTSLIPEFDTGYNNNYVYIQPVGSIPTAELIEFALANNLYIMTSMISTVSLLEQHWHNNGIKLYECNHITNIKDTIRQLANWSLI